VTYVFTGAPSSFASTSRASPRLQQPLSAQQCTATKVPSLQQTDSDCADQNCWGTFCSNYVHACALAV